MMRSKEQTVVAVSVINMVLNILLAAVKLTVGCLSHSGALVSDGVHSVIDIFSSLVVLIGVKLSAHRSDSAHPYGYERMECVAAVVLSILVGATGVAIGIAGVRTVISGTTSEVTTTGTAALITAVAAVIMKEIMFRYTSFTAKHCDSSALMADAWHLRADVLSSVGGCVGALGISFGIPLLDPIASVFIGILISKAAIGIFIDAMRRMTDRSCSVHMQEQINECVLEQQGVLQTEELKTRLFGNRIYVEVTVAVDGEISAKAAYDIAQRICKTVESRFTDVKKCAVHICPI